MQACWCGKKSCKDVRLTSILKTQDHHAASGNSWQPDTCYQHLMQVRRKKNDRAHNVFEKETRERQGS